VILVFIVVAELPVVELLVHVWLGYDVVDKKEDDDVGDVDDEHQSEDGISLLEDG
jgi:hypothetical protein